MQTREIQVQNYEKSKQYVVQTEQVVKNCNN